MAPESLAIEIRNNTTASELYVSITGTHPSSGLFLLSSDGKTPHHPASPSETLTPPSVDVGIPIGKPGATRVLNVPRLSGARIWFSKGKPLKFFVNPGPALVEPSALNRADENYNADWGFAEFTLNEAQLYVNISYVDFVSLPVSLGVVSAGGDGKMRTVPGLPHDGLASVAKGLEKQGGGWEQMVVRKDDGKGAVLRVLSPNSAAVLFPGIWDGYYDRYVSDVWKKYKKQDLTVNTQFTWGDVKGRVDSAGKLLTFKGKESTYSFARPSALDIFSCSTGPFAHNPETTQEQLNVGARLAAAFNRSTFSNAVQPEGEDISKYYKPGTGRATNHYARVCHEVSVGGRGYAFPYDDVGPSGRGEDEDQSGFLNDGNPKRLVISVGKPL
ncbi:glucanase B [Sarocladium strictum]